MADAKLTALTENTTPALTDDLYIVDDPGGTPASQRITVGNLLAVPSPTFTTPSIAKLANLTSNGFVKTSGGDGTLSVDGSTYLTSAGAVTSLTGTANQITASAATGAVTVSVPNSAQLNVAKLTNLTTNGVVKTSGGDGTLSVDTSTYLVSTDDTSHTLDMEEADLSTKQWETVLAGLSEFGVDPSNIGGGTVYFQNPGHRLTTETGVGVSTSDRTSQGTIYWTPYLSNTVTYYTGAAWATKTQTELSLALSVTSGKNYDVFYNGTAISLSSAWTDDTTRADALGTQDGVTVLNSDHSKLWIGTIRASGSNVTEDSSSKRFVWNCFNRAKRSLFRKESTATWTYTTSDYRVVNNDTNNRVEVLVGSANSEISLIAIHVADTSTGVIGSITAIGEDSTTVPAADCMILYAQAINSVGQTGNPSAYINKIVPLGYHAYSWLEWSTASGGTTNWYGETTTAGDITIRTGLTGNISA